jgi:hypothetical protein
MTPEDIDRLIEIANSQSGHRCLLKNSECHEFARLVEIFVATGEIPK